MILTFLRILANQLKKLHFNMPSNYQLLSYIDLENQEITFPQKVYVPVFKGSYKRQLQELQHELNFWIENDVAHYDYNEYRMYTHQRTMMDYLKWYRKFLPPGTYDTLWFCAYYDPIRLGLIMNKPTPEIDVHGFFQTINPNTKSVGITVEFFIQSIKTKFDREFFYMKKDALEGEPVKTY